MVTLNIIGCGRAARTLGRLWAERGAYRVQDVLTRSPAGAAQAVAFVGAGRPIDALAAMRPADVWMLGVPDTAIVEIGEALAASGLLRAGDAVFHLSGFTASSVLEPARKRGARVASAHPVLSFADPQHALAQFAGSLVGLEGDAHLCETLAGAFHVIGGECFALSSDTKPLYHAGSVFASNFLVVIIDVARRLYAEAGVAPEVAERLLAPLATKALDNVLVHGRAALTGPAARGDHAVVEAQGCAVDGFDGDAGGAYAALSRLAVRIATERGRT